MSSRTVCASSASGLGYGNTRSSWISPSISALENEVTAVAVSAMGVSLGPRRLDERSAPANHVSGVGTRLKIWR